MSSDDPYRTLGISRGATQPEVDSAFQRMSALFAGDGDQRSPVNEEMAESRRGEINRAYLAICEDIWRQGQESPDLQSISEAREPPTAAVLATDRSTPYGPSGSHHPTFLKGRGLVAELVALVIIGVGVLTALVVVPALRSDVESGWSSAFRQEVLTGCLRAGGGLERCRCAIDEVEKIYSEDEYARVDLQLRTGGDVPEELVDPISSCNAEFPGETFDHVGGADPEG